MATELEQLLRDIGKLTPGEQRQVRDTLDSLLGARAEPTALQQKLMAAGLVRHVGDASKLAEHIRSFEPVELEGELVSAQIVRERR